MKKHYLTLLTISIFFIPMSLFAHIWRVGANQDYTAPSQVSSLVNNGDTIDIDAGIYPGDVAGWSANNLTFRGVGGMAHLQSNGKAWGQKAIWVIAGDNNYIENIEFSGCSVPDKNGAGIRLEGQGLTIIRCYFHDNENGILTSLSSTKKIHIEQCEFARNGHGDGYSHNLYINHIDTLLFQYNYIHHAFVGHELKSRAHVNIILYNRFSNESDGTASRCIDLPNGGVAILVGNVIHQGASATNNNMVGYGLEGLSNNSPHQFIAVNNTLVNERSICNFFSINASSDLFKAYNNILAGGGNFNLDNFPANTDTATNISGSINDFAFADPSQYDFRLTDQSVLVLDMAANPETFGTILLSPNLIYVHPAQFSQRCIHGQTDIGAYEYCGNVGVIENCSDILSFQLSPNPASSHVTIELTASTNGSGNIIVRNMQGQIMVCQTLQWGVDKNNFILPLENLSPGIYFVHIDTKNAFYTRKLIVQ